MYVFLLKVMDLHHLCVFLLQVRLFEGVRPLQSEVNQLRMACQAEEEQVADYFSEIVQLKKVIVDDTAQVGNY